MGVGGGGMRWRVCSGVQGDAGRGLERTPLASKRATEGGPCS